MKIGEFCGTFRTNEMGLLLRELAPTQVKALSAFEHGRSTNLEHILNYFNNCQTPELEEKFLQGLCATIKGIKHGN